jgi:hypothetical protein
LVPLHHEIEVIFTFFFLNSPFNGNGVPLNQLVKLVYVADGIRTSVPNLSKKTLKCPGKEALKCVLTYLRLSGDSRLHFSVKHMAKFSH